MPNSAPKRSSKPEQKPSLNLQDFTKQAWPFVEPSAFVPNWHLDVIAEHLQAVSAGQLKRLIINIPPRHTKSLFVAVLWPAWEWTFRPQTRWLFASYALSLSKRDSVKCRRLIDSPWYQERFGKSFQLASDQNEKLRFENTESGYRLATSVGGSAIGEGGERIVIDDPHNGQEVESDVIREGVLDWFDGVISTRLNDPKTGAIVIVMQRLHERDLSGHLLENHGEYDHLCLPAEYEPRQQVCLAGLKHDPRTETGTLLCEKRFDSTELAALKKRLGSYQAAGQLQQRPSPAEGGLLKRYWWRYWKPKGSNLPPVMVKNGDGQYHAIEAVELPDTFDEVLQSWDMSFKDEKASRGGDPDNVAGGVWGKAEANRYLLDLVAEQMDFPTTCSVVIAMSAKWPKARLKLVEDKANGPAVIATLSQKIPGLVAVNPEGGKIARVNACSPEIESGNVYLPHPSLYPFVDQFIAECAAFPNGAKDDRVDQMSQALIRMAVPTPRFRSHHLDI